MSKSVFLKNGGIRSVEKGGRVEMINICGSGRRKSK